MLFHTKLADFYLGQDTPKSLSELVAFLSDFTERQTHGNLDNDFWQDGVLTVDKAKQRLEKVRSSYDALVCHCRYATSTLMQLVSNMGITARSVELISGRNTPRDSRHVVTEIFFDQAWMHTDVDMGVMYNSRNSFLSSLEVRALFQEGKESAKNIWRLTQRKKLDHRTHAYLGPVLSKDRKLLEWYSPLMQGVLIGLDMYVGLNIGNSSVTTEDLLEDVVGNKKGKVSLMARDEFTAKYYP